MANSKIINVSNQQRVVFVDNVTNQDAKTLSETYKFGMFLGSGPTGTVTSDMYNHDTGLIYKNGKRYSLVTGISRKPIQISTGNHIYNIKLQIDNDGVLSLSSTPGVEDFVLQAYTSNSNYTPYSSGNILDLYEGDILYFYYIDSETHEPVYYPYDDLLTFDANGYFTTSLDTTNVDSGGQVAAKYKIHALQDSSSTTQTLTVSCATGEHSATTSKTYQFYIHYLSNEIFYIGDVSEISGNINVFDNELVNDLGTAGWHTFDFHAYNLSSQEELYGYYTTEGTGFTITDITKFGVILPDRYSIYLPMRYNMNNGPHVIDYYANSTSTLDGSFQKTASITVNGTAYSVYKYLPGITNTKFINYIGTE